MVDMTLQAYTESGAAVSPAIYIHLDIVQTAEPSSAPEIKSLTPLHSTDTYSIFIRQPGTKWSIRGMQTAHRMDMEDLQSALRYIFRVQSVASTTPPELQSLAGKYLRVLAVKTSPDARQEVLQWSISAQVVVNI